MRTGYSYRAGCSHTPRNKGTHFLSNDIIALKSGNTQALLFSLLYAPFEKLWGARGEMSLFSLPLYERLYRVKSIGSRTSDIQLMTR